MALKFLAPQRWDVIVYRSPDNPAIPYAKRLVGLPGEEIAIRDGEIVIHGEVARKPPEIAALAYVADPRDESKTDWGPVRLGDDEYLVLGDFSLQSADARVWQHGVAGHPPYALPKDYITGVVTHIHWPPSRWCIFR